MTLRRGSSGDNVRRLQERLRDLGLYPGPIDSAFGGGSESGVKTFQAREHLPATGCVDAATWDRLFPGQPPPQPELAGAPVADRCLALTGSFETGAQPPDCFCGISGDFDGQGISFGVLQWNIGQGTLQPLLQSFVEQHSGLAGDIFHDNLDTLRSLAAASRDDQLEFTRSSVVQHRGQVNEPWRGMLRTMGRTPEFRSIQAQEAAGKYQKGLAICGEYGLKSQRAAALMFDIVTQNGSINDIVKAQILADFKTVAASSAEDLEVAKMRIVANRRAAVAKKEFVDDVRTRKLTIAEGKGTVHGITYDLEDTFGLTLQPL